MSLIPRCVQCDSPTDPYGRDGGMPLCKRCLTELRQPVPYTPISFDTDGLTESLPDPLLRKDAA